VRAVTVVGVGGLVCEDGGLLSGWGVSAAEERRDDSFLLSKLFLLEL
jgi:hypothetical protein